MSDQIISVIVIQVFGIIGFIVKSWYDQRRNKNEVSRRDQILKEKIEGIADTGARNEIKLNDINNKLDIHISDNDFEIQFRNILQTRAFDKIYAIGEFDPNYINIMVFWTDSIEKMGLKYYHSTQRKLKKDIKEYLEIDSSVRLNTLYKYIDSTIPVIKIDIGKKVSFSEFMEKKKIFSQFYSLVHTLERNGFKDNNEIISEFETYIKNFYTLFMTAIRVWSELKVYESKDHLD